MTTVRDLHRAVPTTRRIDWEGCWRSPIVLLSVLSVLFYVLLGAFIWWVAQW